MAAAMEFAARMGNRLTVSALMTPTSKPAMAGFL
jgi:hypothetical protein